MTSAEAVKVIVGTRTLSPGPTPIASSPRCSADVQELTAMANVCPTSRANLRSNSWALLAVVSQPLSRTSLRRSVRCHHMKRARTVCFLVLLRS